MKSARASFKKLRVEMMKAAKDTQEDLRSRQYLTASQDLYQWFSEEVGNPNAATKSRSHEDY